MGVTRIEARILDEVATPTDLLRTLPFDVHLPTRVDIEGCDAGTPMQSTLGKGAAYRDMLRRLATQFG
jgi:hypothetical protein